MLSDLSWRLGAVVQAGRPQSIVNPTCANGATAFVCSAVAAFFLQINRLHELKLAAKCQQPKGKVD